MQLEIIIAMMDKLSQKYRVEQSRLARLRMFKDLKSVNKSPLPQNLIDIRQIEDLSKVFKAKKGSYRIGDQSVDLVTECQTHEASQTNISLTPQERFEQYKKQQNHEKMKETINNLSKKKIKPIKLRKPVVYKLLEGFQKRLRNQEIPQFCHELKRSQKNLEHIKMNSKIKVESLVSYFEVAEKRQRFVSLQTGLPQKPNEKYPTFAEMLESRYSNKEATCKFSPGSLELALDRIMPNHANEHKQNNLAAYNKSSIILQGTPSPDERHAKTHSHLKVAVHADRAFQKSESSSKAVVKTMTDFYHSKSSKKQQYDNMVRYLKHDRPLTTKIRRMNYSVDAKRQMHSVDACRRSSEEQRKKLQYRNYEFYMSLLGVVQYCEQSEIPTSLQLIEEIRGVLEQEYQLTMEHVNKIMAKISMYKLDQMTNRILQLLGNFVGCEIVPSKNSS